YAMLEIMGSNLRTQETIRLGESEGKSFYEITDASQPFGWRTFDYSVLEAYEQGKITEETALLYCTKRGPVTRGMDNIKKSRGGSWRIPDSFQPDPLPGCPDRGIVRREQHRREPDLESAAKYAHGPAPPCHHHSHRQFISNVHAARSFSAKRQRGHQQFRIVF